MIRFVIGMILVLGAVSDIDLSSAPWWYHITVAAAGLGLMYWGTRCWHPQ